MASRCDALGPRWAKMGPRLSRMGPGWPARWSKMVQAAPVWAQMATKMAQPRNKMGHPDLSVGGSQRFREVFSEGFWLKVVWF